MRALVLAILSSLTLVAAVTVAVAFNPDSPPPPWSARCLVAIRGHEDGSASLYCRGSSRAFGAVDAETGRVRLHVPR